MLCDIYEIFGFESFFVSPGKLIMTTDNPDCWTIFGLTDIFDEQAEELVVDVDDPDKIERYKTANKV